MRQAAEWRGIRDRINALLQAHAREQKRLALSCNATYSCETDDRHVNHQYIAPMLNLMCNFTIAFGSHDAVA
jgi:hypothetical protein